MKESALVSTILRWLRTNGFWAEKRHGSRYVTAGLPDIDALKDRQSFDFEVKTPGNRPTKIQDYQISRLRSHGSVACVVWSVDDVRIISEAFESGGYELAIIAANRDYENGR